MRPVMTMCSKMELINKIMKDKKKKKRERTSYSLRHFMIWLLWK